MVLDKIKEILSIQLGVDEDIINEDTDVMDDLGADSLDVVELMMTLEGEFGLMITDEKVSEFKTVGDIAKYIEELTDK